MTTPTPKIEQRDGLDRIWHAAIFSIAGFRLAWQKEAAFRQETLLAAAMLPGAYWIGDSAIEQLLLIGSLAIVLIAELLNSAIEATVDRIGTELHPLSGQAKDMGSAAVAVSLIFVVVVWVTLLLDGF